MAYGFLKGVAAGAIIAATAVVATSQSGPVRQVLLEPPVLSDCLGSAAEISSVLPEAPGPARVPDPGPAVVQSVAPEGPPAPGAEPAPDRLAEAVAPVAVAVPSRLPSPRAEDARPTPPAEEAAAVRAGDAVPEMTVPVPVAAPGTDGGDAAGLARSRPPHLGSDEGGTGPSGEGGGDADESSQVRHPALEAIPSTRDAVIVPGRALGGAGSSPVARGPLRVGDRAIDGEVGVSMGQSFRDPVSERRAGRRAPAGPGSSAWLAGSEMGRSGPATRVSERIDGGRSALRPTSLSVGLATRAVAGPTGLDGDGCGIAPRSGCRATARLPVGSDPFPSVAGAASHRTGPWSGDPAAHARG